MPIRVPQASLVPQLREHGREDGERGAASGAEEEPDDRSPEVTRDMFIRMQEGWQRGRVDDLDDPAGAPENGNDR
jgi:hypothetical protein